MIPSADAANWTISLLLLSLPPTSCLLVSRKLLVMAQDDLPYLAFSFPYLSFSHSPTLCRLTYYSQASCKVFPDVGLDHFDSEMPDHPWILGLIIPITKTRLYWDNQYSYARTADG